jgi:class 3 adenylate cyclase/tetratricopeptide (TPR) repeat protein
MKCPKCDFDNPNEMQFCGKCGSKLITPCPKCGSVNPPEFQFCGKCGTKITEAVSATQIPKLEDMQRQLQDRIPQSLADRLFAGAKQMQGETRLVTAMFADISGFTPASEKMSPEELVDLVNLCFKEIVDTICIYEGSVNRFIGDCVLAFFGVPIAHENDPERAILAALEMHDKVMKLNRNISVGINTGVMYVGSIGSDLHVEYTAEGYQINLAKRLQEFADAGQIIIGESTYRFTQRAFAFDKLSPLSMKGISQQVQAYSVVRPLEHPEKLRGIEGLQARMIGREREFLSLIDSANCLIDEHKGQIVNIVGEAGIGKSRLGRELREYLKVKDVSVLEGRCISIGQSMSFWPFIDMMRVYLGISGEDNESQVADKLIQRMTELFDQGADGIIPYVGHMMSLKLPDKYQELIRYAAPEQIRHQILLRMRDVFKMIASKKPLVLILEDIHWADELSLALMWVLMDELVATQMMLIGIHRPEQEHGSWQIDMIASKKHIERYTPIHLKPLTMQQTDMMIESLLQIEDMPSAIRSSIIEKTDGNPFFVEEMVRWLIEQGLIFKDGDHWKAKAEIAELTVPDTIQSVILSRIDRLHEEVKYLLQCASVIGRVFQHRLLAYIAGQGDTLESHITALEKNELVYKDKIVPELEYAFKHALTQETTYQGMLNRQRSLFHERIANGIEFLYQDQLEEYYEQLAYHYSRCNSKGKAMEYLLKAGQKATQRYANETALDYFQKALDIAETNAEREVVLNHRAKLLITLYRAKEALEDYEMLMEYAKQEQDRHKELFALLGIAHAYCIIALDDAQFAQKSYDLCLQAYKMALELNDKEGIVRSLSPMVTYCSSFGLLTTEEWKAYAKIIIDTAIETGDDELIMQARMFGASNETGEELAEFLRQRNDLVRLKEVLWGLTFKNISIGDFRKAIEFANTTIHISSEISAPPVMYPTLKAYALIRLGDYKSAWESLQQEIADPSHKFGQMMKNFGMGVFYSEMSDYKKAKEILEIVVQQSIELKRPWMERVARFQLANAIIEAIKCGITDISELDQIVLPELGEPYHIIRPPRVVAGEIEMFRGNLNEALKLSEQVYTEVAQFDGRYYKVSHIGLSSRILLKMGKFDEVLARIDEGIEISEEMGYLPMLWQLQALKAQALEKLGSLEEANREYKASAEIIKRLADNIHDEGFRRSFMSNPLITMIFNKSKERG